MGEVRDTPQDFRLKETPYPTPVPRLLGSVDCIENGESQLPSRRWQPAGSDLSGEGPEVAVVVNWPEVVFSWPSNEIPDCVPMLADDNTYSLADDDTIGLASCPDCVPMLADDNTYSLADDDTIGLASCCPCPSMLADDNTYSLATDDSIGLVGCNCP